MNREITNPAMGSSQEPTAITWKSSLRSPSPSPRGPLSSTTRSRSRNRDSLRESLRSRTPSPTLNRSLNQSTEISPTRKSVNRLKNSFITSAELKQLENDYIKNLQQQVYFLELEANHLRDQARKATEMHPKMTTEADRMLKKLRSMQNEVDGLQVEVRRKEASLDLMTREKSKVLAQLSEQEKLRERERRMLQGEITETKRERDRITLENTRLDNQIVRLTEENDSLNRKLIDSQNAVMSLREDLTSKSEDLRVTQIQLDDSRVSCSQSEARLREVEDHYHGTVTRQHAKQISQLKDEITSLEARLNNSDRRKHEETILKSRVEDEVVQLVKENNALSAQLTDLNMRLSAEKDLRNDIELRRSKNLVELSELSDREKEMKTEIHTFDEALMREKARNDRLVEQIRLLESNSAESDLQLSRLRTKLSSVEVEQATSEKEIISLQHEKQVLTEHIADLQRRLSRNEVDLDSSKSRLRDLEAELTVVETEKKTEEFVQSEKWKEFENLADSMKKISRTMATSSGTLGTGRKN